MIHANPPVSLRMDATTVCQLKCPSCPTAAGEIKKSIGSGSLAPEDFARMLDANPSIAHVELSNWGEIFLNKRLPEIMQIAYERDVALTAANGVNLNTVKRETLEALVRYRFKHLSCSIDGASQETYVQYRRNGNFDQVIENIRTINEFKAQYDSPFPVLLWQYIAFGHNEHEIEKARALADELGMIFYVKLSWDEEFSPIKDVEYVRKQTRSGAASRTEFAEKTGGQYLVHSVCRQLWEQPQVNYDGNVLGCCVNTWGSFGNAFEDGLMESLDGEKMRYARGMLLGDKPARDDIPCTTCKNYVEMVENDSFMDDSELDLPTIRGVRNALLRRFGRRIISTTASRNRLVNRGFAFAIRQAANRMLS